MNSDEKPRSHREIGSEGEDIAVEYLLSKNYSVIARNYYASHAELDIIALDPDGETVVFCEVKSRAESVAEKYGRPATAVGRTKQKFLVYAANDYIKKHPRECGGRRVRIDVIEVYLPRDGVPKVRHLRNAVTARVGYNM